MRVQPATLTHLRSAPLILQVSTSAIDILAGQGHFSRSGVTYPHEISGLARGSLAFLGIASVAAVGLALADLTAGSGMAGMAMTHYMELLAVRQPWNLLLFMALPVILAETLAITELVMLLGRRNDRPAAPWVARLSRAAGLLAGPVWVFIGTHLMVHAVVPLTMNGGWRGPADVIAVLSSLVGGLPMLVISLLEAGVLGRSSENRLRMHVAMVAAFLVVAHVAMIFGMVDPAVLGGDTSSSVMTHDMGGMSGMNHDMGSMNHNMSPSSQPTR